MKQLDMETENLQNENQDLINTLNSQNQRKEFMQTRAVKRQKDKLKRVKNMLERIMVKKRFN